MISPRFQIFSLSHLTSFLIFDVVLLIYFSICIFLDLTTNVKVQCARYSGTLADASDYDTTLFSLFRT